MLCPVMQLDFTDTVGRYDEVGAARYSDEDLRYGILWAESYLADGYTNEPMKGYDLKAFAKWCEMKLKEVMMSRPRRKPKPGNKVHVQDGIDFDCPFCDGKCTASEEHTMVVHSVPFCDEFQELEVTDFLRAANEKMKSSP